MTPACMMLSNQRMGSSMLLKLMASSPEIGCEAEIFATEGYDYDGNFWRYYRDRLAADPDLLVLFEDWLEELEAEVVALLKTHGPLDSKGLADKLGLSVRGATFLLSKLERTGNGV